MIKVSLQPIVSKLNLPTVLKTTILPGDSIETLFIATQVGEIFYIRNGSLGTFLDIRPRVIKLGASRGGYDERGLLGLAFHPGFCYNGLFYLHYSAAGTQGPGALICLYITHLIVYMLTLFNVILSNNEGPSSSYNLAIK